MLNQFGAVMTYAIELERGLADFYNAAAAALPDHAEALSARATASAKRAKKLQRSRQMDVTEITLEPIEGLDEANYRFDLETHTAANIDAITATAARFYAEAAPKINVRESRRLLERCAKDYQNTPSLA